MAISAFQRKRLILSTGRLNGSLPHSGLNASRWDGLYSSIEALEHAADLEAAVTHRVQTKAGQPDIAHVHRANSD